MGARGSTVLTPCPWPCGPMLLPPAWVPMGSTRSNATKASILELDKVHMPGLRGQERWPSVLQKEREMGNSPSSEAATGPSPTHRRRR